MNIEEWWSRLTPTEREWLIAHNGEPVDPQVAAAIARAGGSFDSQVWAVASDSSLPFELSDEAVDWIETVANQENPELT